MTYAEWLAAKLGTRMWVVAPRLTKYLAGQGYDLAIPQKTFTALRREFLDLRIAA